MWIKAASNPARVVLHLHWRRDWHRSVSIDVKAVSNSGLCRCFSLNCVPKEFFSSLQSVCANRQICVSVYSGFSPEFTTISSVLQCCLSSFGCSLSDLEYVDDVVILNEDPNKLELFLNDLNGEAATCEIRVPPSKCRILLRDWIGPNPNLIVGWGGRWKGLAEFDKFLICAVLSH